MQNIKAGTARVTVGAHYGWKDWFAQRITGVIILVFLVMMMGRFMLASDLSYNGWHHFMSNGLVKAITFFGILAAVYHAWIGVRDIWMDYVKPVGIRLTLHLLTLLWLAYCAAYGVAAVWAI